MKRAIEALLSTGHELRETLLIDGHNQRIDSSVTLSVEVMARDSGLIDWKSMHCSSSESHREDEEVLLSRHSALKVQLKSD